MIRPKSDTEDSLLSLTKKCETLIEQTHRTAQETLEFQLNKSGEKFHLQPPFSIEGSWMIKLTTLEVYNSIFIINTTNKKIDLYTDTFEKFSFEQLEAELEEILTNTDIPSSHLQHEKLGPRIVEAYKKRGP